MNPWVGISFALALIILIFTSTILGLIRHNVLLNSDCCVVDSPCAAILDQQKTIYYDPITGLRTRYILATVFLVVTVFLRTPPLIIALHWLIVPLQNPIFLALLALMTFTLQLLFADLTLHNLADSPIGLVPSCSITSLILVGAINVLAWFCLILNFGLFFLFIVSQNAVHHYVPVLKFTKNVGEGDDEDEVVFGDARIRAL